MRIHKPVREEELLKSGDRYSTIGGYTGAREKVNDLQHVPTQY